jgi:predicted RNA-binding protein with RPS1 domain
VSSLKPYGAFVRIEQLGRDGLLHISEAAHERVDLIEDVLKVKQPVFAKVLSLQNGKISLSLKDVDQVTGEDMNPHTDTGDTFDYGGSAGKGVKRLLPIVITSASSGSAEAPPLYSIHQGTIFRLMEFGIFVAIDDFREHGLVHISQIRHFRIEKISDLYSEESIGDRVWVKVVGVQTEPRMKISLSLKFVNQQTGQDLDPDNTLWMEEQAFKAASQQKAGTGTGPPQATPAPLTIANNTLFCVRCGTVGHEEATCPFFKDHRKKSLAVAVDITSDADESSSDHGIDIEIGLLESKFAPEGTLVEADSPEQKAKKSKKDTHPSKKAKKSHRDAEIPKSRDMEAQTFLAEAQRLRMLRKAKKAAKGTKEKKKHSKKHR